MKMLINYDKSNIKETILAGMTIVNAREYSLKHIEFVNNLGAGKYSVVKVKDITKLISIELKDSFDNIVETSKSYGVIDYVDNFNIGGYSNYILITIRSTTEVKYLACGENLGDLDLDEDIKIIDKYEDILKEVFNICEEMKIDTLGTWTMFYLVANMDKLNMNMVDINYKSIGSKISEYGMKVMCKVNEDRTVIERNGISIISALTKFSNRYVGRVDNFRLSHVEKILDIETNNSYNNNRDVLNKDMVLQLKDDTLSVMKMNYLEL